MKAKPVTLAILSLSLLSYGAFLYWSRRNISPVERGWSIAYEHGCFTCHGPGGTRGMPDPGYGEGDVPAWSRGLITMYAESEEEIREWILDGVTKRVKQDKAEMKVREKAEIRMPAWRGILSESEVKDLVAYVVAASDLNTPGEKGADEGRVEALKMGCFSCHGPQGRGTPPNSRAFKGYIPSWDGSDFPDLAKDDSEIREWVLDGGTARLRSNPLARFFTRRQAIKMPAYRGYVSDLQVSRLVDYIHWLRTSPQKEESR